ncbi:hypothetical protein BK126_10680 [Paenibacillus sp. FSL H7-0326]|uniref:hypothetical protein n=1 Tax=Paenibacillus sp. FSL H7-0326 TaxID=1921144 RepID=UPI00096CB6CA|nr:hypothetical protein [Paenibacillus sp. FSL H7-0326]OMC68309.1 hypothetical protein BK126_10680 [Paenibacillus sp. FSL H7-0326]
MTIQRMTNSLQIDDYLDLLNYAIRIDDTEWQQEIINLMKNYTEQKKNMDTPVLRNELWLQFDALNDELLSLFKQLSLEKDEAEKAKVTERIWELKYERVMISQKLESIVNRKHHSSK